MKKELKKPKQENCIEEEKINIYAYNFEVCSVSGTFNVCGLE